jgi:hypothetical protein
MPKVDFIYDEDCPQVEPARQQLRKALESCQLPLNWTEYKIGDTHMPDYGKGYGSPTILINGKDLVGLTPTSDKTCRLYLNNGAENCGVPSTGQIISFLQKAPK